MLNGDALFPQNSNCFECEWGLSIFDVRHRFVTSVLYELPFGPGKPFAQTGVGSAIFGGWQISAIVNKSSGFPRDPAAGTDIPNTGVADLPSEPRERPGSQRRATDGAAVVQYRGVRASRRVHLRERRAQHRHRTRASSRPTCRSSGTSGSADAGSLQFRLEAFNVFNNPVWGDPEHVDGESARTGTINTTRTPMRELQLGVKFSF